MVPTPPTPHHISRGLFNLKFFLLSIKSTKITDSYVKLFKFGCKINILGSFSDQRPF